MNLRSFISASMLVVVGMVSGRLLGMLREMMMAAHFGTGHVGDMAITLLMIPDFITSALIGAAVSSALVPAFAARPPERALALLWQALALSVALFSVVVLVLSLKAPWLLAQFKTQAATPEIVRALTIALASIPFAVATAVLTAYLQHTGKFFVPAFATVIFNLVIIAFLWCGTGSLYWLAIGIFAAGFARFVPHLGAFLRHQTSPRLRFTPWEFDRKLLKIYGLTAGSGLFGLMPVYAPYGVVAALGSSIALFNYSFKLVLLPGLLGQTVIQLVLLPWLVARRKDNPGQATSPHTTIALQSAWLIALSMAIALTLAAHPIAAIFFSYGKMTAADIAQIGALFAIGVWALPAMLLMTLWQVIFYSEERAGPPLIVNTLQALLIVPLCWLGHGWSGLEGVLIALVGLQTCCVVLLAILAYRSGVSRRLLPSFAYFKMTLAVLLVSMPFFYVTHTIAVSAIGAFVLAVVCGVMSLGAGAATFAARPAAMQAMGEAVKTILITNDPGIAADAQSAGVTRIMVDLEWMGKKERQASRTTFLSTHRREDIQRVRDILTTSELIVRVNPWNPDSPGELEMVLACNPDIVMLPMITQMDDFRAFIATLNGRAAPMPLVETAYSMAQIAQIAAMPEVKEIYLGLNDLHLSLGLDFLFEPLALGLVDWMAERIKASGKPFGFGGLAVMGSGELPAERILGEHLRMGSGCVILSSRFCKDIDIANPDGRVTRLQHALARMAQEEQRLLTRTPAEQQADAAATAATIHALATSIRKQRTSA